MHHYVITKAEKEEMGFQSTHFQAVLSSGKKHSINYKQLSKMLQLHGATSGKALGSSRDDFPTLETATRSSWQHFVTVI